MKMRKEAGQLFLQRQVFQITALGGPPPPACSPARPAQLVRMLALPTEPGTPEHP